MTSPLQVLYFIAITLAPPGAHHINVSSGSEVYAWDRDASKNEDSTWVYDGVVDPKQVLVNNAIVPNDVSYEQRAIVNAACRNSRSHFILYFDDAHQLEKNSQGYVYVVRAGSPNQKSYSFTFRP